MNDENGSEIRHETFLGLSKMQFLMVSVVMLIFSVGVSLGTFAYAVSANSARIADGAKRDAEIQDIAQRADDQAAQLESLVHANTAAFCAQAKAYQAQIEETSNFLAKNQQDVFFDGTVSREQLYASLKRQRELRNSITEVVDCSKP